MILFNQVRNVGKVVMISLFLHPQESFLIKTWSDRCDPMGRLQTCYTGVPFATLYLLLSEQALVEAEV
jgi:hypothetical protein